MLDFGGAFSPSFDFSSECFAAGVTESELLLAEPVEAGEHVREHPRGEAAVFLCREFEEPFEAVTGLDGHEVYKVAGFGAPEYGEHLVDRELLAAEGGSESSGLGGEQSCVSAEVDLRPVVVALGHKPGEAGIVLDAMNGEARASEGVVDGRHEPIDGGRRETEEVEIAGLPEYVTANDQRGSAGECEAFGFLKFATIAATCSWSGLSTTHRGGDG